MEEDDFDEDDFVAGKETEGEANDKEETQDEWYSKKSGWIKQRSSLHRFWEIPETKQRLWTALSGWNEEAAGSKRPNHRDETFEDDTTSNKEVNKIV